MPANSWRESDSFSDPIRMNSLLSNLPEPLDDNDLDDSLTSSHLFDRGMEGRRQKAAVAITMIWGGTIALHLLSWGIWLVWGLTTLMSIHALRVLLARPLPPAKLLSSDDPEACPYVSMLVAAKNEEAVIGSLVKDLCSLDYPSSRYDLWIIDDNSTDRTPQVLEKLAQDYPQLHVVRRSANAGGGKSGALNEVWELTQGDIIAVFDADAQVPKELLRRVAPLFDRETIGAVQVRKAIVNGLTNLWTRGQTAEMAFDSYVQQQRIAIGGIGELRGNGQFVRRAALEHCGGWNEETITDDLDLTLRLHLNRWEIDLLMTPPVGEEGVTTATALWHQRNRWAEGGYQRYLDYWRLLVRNRMGTTKSIDLLMFMMSQYLLPTASVPDMLMAIVRSTPPVLAPITSLMITFSLINLFLGIRATQKETVRSQSAAGTARSRRLPIGVANAMAQTLFGTLYMLHWIPVMASTTLRMAVRPKRLKWVKTVHHGSKQG
ncbi:glycosyltransferase family 2 protein [Leptolyngbya sp. FACHB-711]|uniref:glycosyltransferase n=1 Tax=unclassified Leptolyngbya TaxID=2650499 RepID=UPI0016845449|nr:glycosyltransferase family 2 protein [Cyanobacteria bacterium FACHB-502]MBD2024672.1 glycosyltransferase family 2 protein [Leptolyngbya sp. FACHB-711]